jgi:hypothetical protein
VDVYERVEPAWPTAAQLKELAGRYVSDEIEATFTVGVDGDHLVLRRRPDTTIALTPVHADGFSSSLGFFVVFERDASKRVTALTLTHERVWNLRFARQPDVPVRGAH